MKTVFTNRMLAHVWAQLRQIHGHNSSSSMSFDGSMALSYREPMAHIVQPTGSSTVPGYRVALFRSERFSVTTMRHLSYYKDASIQYTQFVVPNLLAGRFYLEGEDFAAAHAENVEYLTKSYTDERDSLMRANPAGDRLKDIPSSSFDDHTRAHKTLRVLADKLTNYCEAFGLRPVYLPWADDANKVIARRDRLLNDPKRVARREREQARMDERERAEAHIRASERAHNISLFRSGEARFATILDNQGGALLRIKGDSVETSLGAEVPVADALRAMAFWRKTVNANALPWSRGDSITGDVLTIVGKFKFDSIDEQGNVRAGCHLLKRKELERIEKALAEAFPS